MQSFLFYIPTKICFGVDTTDGIGDMLRDLGATSPLLVTDANLIKVGVLSSILDNLSGSGMAPIVFDKVPADSDLDCVREATELARENCCNCIIAVGGGSVIDTAKAVNIGLSLAGDVLDYEGINTITTRLFPMIAVPTTAGTGSEVSTAALIKDHQENKKLLFASKFLFPDVAILDPKLLVTLPAKLTAATGLDALTHAIESYVAATSNSPSDAFSLEALRLLFTHLPTATANGADQEARSATLVASMMAGVAFSNAGVGIVHALAHAVGSKYGTHHGLTNAIFLPFGMEFNLDVIAGKLATAYTFLCAALTETDQPSRQWFKPERQNTLSDVDLAKRLIVAVKALVDYLNLPSSLSKIGIASLSEEDLQELATMAQTDPAMMFNPKPASQEDLIAIIKGAY